MQKYNFYIPITVRYGDLDPQGHVNNAKYLTYFEHARTRYMREVKLFPKGLSFLDIGVILADIHVAFYKPILWENNIKAGVKTIQLGNKSMKVGQIIEGKDDGILYAEGEVVMVTFNYHTKKTISIPDEWRKLIDDYERVSNK